MQSGGMQVEASQDSMMDNQVDANTLRTLAAILRQAEATAGERGADPGALALSEMIAASKVVLANARPPDDVNRFVCYRALLKLAAGKRLNVAYLSARSPRLTLGNGARVFSRSLQTRVPIGGES